MSSTFNIASAHAQQRWCPTCETRLNVAQLPPWRCPICGDLVPRHRALREDDDA
jgi:predicted RNA-binding Zn-ribbon protein involved in translation (DUF1610 family)